MNQPLSAQILGLLERRQPPAAFVTEIEALLERSPRDRELDEALSQLEREGRIVVADHASPDLHLDGADLRVVARVDPHGNGGGGIEAADGVWGTWLRAFLATHRCQ